MTDISSEEVKRLFDGVADELSRMGLAEDLDFYLVGRVKIPAPSSEHIGMSYRDGLFRVWYKDMAQKKPVVESPDFGEARAAFVDQALHLAAGRGRGPRARQQGR